MHARVELCTLYAYVRVFANSNKPIASFENFANKGFLYMYIYRPLPKQNPAAIIEATITAAANFAMMPRSHTYETDYVEIEIALTARSDNSFLGVCECPPNLSHAERSVYSNRHINSKP